MKKLIDILYDYLLKGKEIPEDLLYEFSQDTIKIIQHRSTDEIPSTFWNLQHYVEMFWRGKKYKKEKNPILIYQMGQMLAYTNMVRDIADENERTMNLDEYARRWENKYLVFKGIHDVPGITHKKLAAVSHQSVSSLSQFIAKTKWDGYIIYRTGGREKYYYLTENGEKLYKLLNDKQKKPIRLKQYQFHNLDSNYSEYYYDTSYKEKIVTAVVANGNGTKPDIKEFIISTVPGEVNKEKDGREYKAIKKEALYAATANRFIGG